jgi:hypothetical protein
MKIPKPESLGLLAGAGNLELKFAPGEGRLILACVAPVSADPELLAGRVYSRRASERQYSLIGSTDPLESWTSPLPWSAGILVVSTRISPATLSDATLNEFSGIKYAEFSGSTAKIMWSPPDARLWIRQLLGQGSQPEEIVCVVGRVIPSSNDIAQYTVAALDLGRGTVTDITVLAAPGY